MIINVGPSVVRAKGKVVGLELCRDLRSLRNRVSSNGDFSRTEPKVKTHTKVPAQVSRCPGPPLEGLSHFRFLSWPVGRFFLLEGRGKPRSHATAATAQRPDAVILRAGGEDRYKNSPYKMII